MQTIPPNSNRSGEISGFLSNKRWSKFGGHLNREIQDERERGAGATSITDNGQRRRVPMIALWVFPAAAAIICWTKF